MDGVLCHLDDPARIGYLSRISGRPASQIMNAIWESGFEDLSDSGQLSADEYLKGFGERIGYPLSKAEWTEYRKSGTTPIPESLRLVMELKDRVQLAVLTNNGLMLQETMPVVFPELSRVFGPHVYVSAQFSTRKPDPNIYLRVCDALSVSPSETLMVDDRADNIEGAVQAGLQGHVFTTCDLLRQELSSQLLL